MVNDPRYNHMVAVANRLKQQQQAQASPNASADASGGFWKCLLD